MEGWSAAPLGKKDPVNATFRIFSSLKPINFELEFGEWSHETSIVCSLSLGTQKHVQNDFSYH